VNPLLQHRDAVDSTNDEVRAEVLRGCQDGYAIYASEQRAGRGRHGRVWVSVGGVQLYMSVALTGPQWQAHAMQVPLAAGVGACRALLECASVSLSLKWPNDLIIDDKKVGGILCEGVSDGRGFRGIVVGIGVNLGHPTSEVPDTIATRAAFLASMGALPELHVIASGVRRHIHASALELVRGRTQEIIAAWRDLDGMIGRPVQVWVDGTQRPGIAKGVRPNGALVVRVDDRDVEIVSGEVIWT